MIRKTSRGYKVLSEKTGKNLGGLTKLAPRHKSACARWNFSNAARVRLFSCSESRRRNQLRAFHCNIIAQFPPGYGASCAVLGRR